jgi:hypothetical protein
MRSSKLTSQRSTHRSSVKPRSSPTFLFLNVYRVNASGQEQIYSLRDHGATSVEPTLRPDVGAWPTCRVPTRISRDSTCKSQASKPSQLEETAQSLYYRRSGVPVVAGFAPQ